MEHIEWESFLPEKLNNRAPDAAKLMAIFSLLVHLDISLAQFLIWLFSSKHPKVRLRAARFLSFQPTHAIPFAPKVVYNHWHQFPNSVPHLHRELMTPCAHEVALAESNRLLEDPSLRVRVSNCTLNSLRDALDPFQLVRKFREVSPFVFGLLMTLAAAPNTWGRRQASKKAREKGSSSSAQLDSEDEQSAGESDAGPEHPDHRQTFNSFAEWGKEFEHFHIKALVPIVFIISMLLFIRHSRVNILALPVGLFLRIGGADKRLVTVLNSIGLCVSYYTVERLKQALSEDAVRLAQNLIRSGRSWFMVFDNINVYLRKFEQRLTNKNSMLSLTNTAMIAQPDVMRDSLNLQSVLNLRGKRSQATVRDIVITPDESIHMRQAMAAIVAQLLVAFCPNSTAWPDYSNTKKRAAAMTPVDRPLPVKKTETYPFGVLDINEGSKRGCVMVMEALQKKSSLSQEEWSSLVRIVMGDWLTSNNLRAARRERTDDISPFEQLLYLKEISALWHYGLNTLQMIIKTHLGNAIDDPGSLASHKGLLGRVWDVNKPNYAAAKSLVRHSLIARLLNIVMKIKGFSQYSQLSTWKPSFTEIHDISTRIVTEFATPNAAKIAQAKGDDWLAHSIYFIRDSLFFLVFEKYVSIADAGGVLRVFKFWVYLFRGAGMWNYARECLEVLLLWKYELPPGLRAALENAWFVNRWGQPGRWIPTDLYLEHMNYWVKRVFIAQGSGVTAEYMASKGSACVEAFQDITHKIVQFTGTQDISRKHKEAKFHLDVRALADHMQRHNLHVLSPTRRFIPVATKKGAEKSQSTERSAISDVMTMGAVHLLRGGFEEFLHQTAFDPALGWPLDRSNASESDVLGSSEGSGSHVLSFEEEADLDTGSNAEPLGPGSGALGGGTDFD